MRTSATEFSCLCEFGDEGDNKNLHDERRTEEGNKQIESRFCTERGSHVLVVNTYNNYNNYTCNNCNN